MSAGASDFGQPIPGYEIVELLGSGGMSSVYRARQKGLEREVAIKVIRRDQLDPRTALARLTKEARVLARLDHPGIVRSIDFGEAGDLVYFVMELVEGRSCKDLLSERGRLALHEVLTIGASVAAALEHAAAHGVVHRDVKPGNILLARDGAVKLTDFGLARATSDRSLTKVGITVGTPQYMSPEQVKSPRRVDLRSDFYSLGATLYHLAMGRAPFQGETVGEILHEVLYGRPVPPEQVDPAVPPAFSRVLARLLARDPARRYATAAALGEDLDRVRAAIAGADGETEVGLSWQDAGEPPPRRAWPWLLVAAGVVVAVATAALLHQGGRAAPPRDLAAAELRLIADQVDALENGRRPAVAVAFDLSRLRDEGTLTALSGSERIAAMTRARDSFTRAVTGAARQAEIAARGALARADFAAARAAFDRALQNSCDVLLPDVARASLAQRLPEFDDALRRAGQEGLARFEALADEVRKEVARTLREVRDQSSRDLSDALERSDFVGAQAIIAGEAARESKACAQATRTVLIRASVALAPDLTDEQVVKGWPDSVAQEFAREPLEGLVSLWRDDLEFELVGCEKQVVRDIADATDRDVSALDAAGGATPRRTAEADAEEIARRSRELRAKVEERRAALAAAAQPVAAIDTRLDEHRRILERAVAHRRERRDADELTLLLEGDGDDPGLDDLLRDRKLAEARARVEGAGAVAAADRARWSEVIDLLERCVTDAEAALRAAVGSDLELRDRRGIKWRGPVAEETAGSFHVGARAGVRAVDLDLETLKTLAPARDLDGRARWILAYYFGERAKGRAANELDAALAAAGDDPVAVHLRALRVGERANAQERAQQRESEAAASKSALEAALGSGDLAAGENAWSRLQGLRDTPTAKATLRERRKYEEALDGLRRGDLRQKTLQSLVPHASERVVETDGRVRFTYLFSDPDQGPDFGIRGNDVHVENGRMHFAGGAAGEHAKLYGPFLPLPIDRAAPATLTLQVTPSIEAPKDPHFFAIRFLDVCVAFFRPDEPARETCPPQLAAWFGSLDDYGDYLVEPTLQTQPRKGKTAAVGLDRGQVAEIELRWIPGSGEGGTCEVWVRGEKAFVLTGQAEKPAPRAKYGIEVRSRTALDIGSLQFTGRLRE
jgi:tRNA A-37 threonylcarbamoyl transferase component Bud32